jgi:hypothetical protein
MKKNEWKMMKLFFVVSIAERCFAFEKKAAVLQSNILGK